MAWTLTVGNEQIEFGCDLEGLGLMRTPRIRPLIEMESFGNPRDDNRRLGRVFRRGQVVSFDVEARPDHRPVDVVWREFLRVWRADSIRRIPGASAVLTADSGRSVMGMPVGVDPSMELRLFDTNRATVEFEASDDLWFGPEVVTSVQLVPELTGGLPVPASVPFVLGGGDGQSDYLVDVAGDAEAWPVFEVHGPIVDPWVEVAGVGRLQFKVSLAYDQTLTVDTRPSARWVMRDGAALPGALLPAGARLSDMRLLPGGHRVFFGGYDPSGTARLDVRVSPAFVSF